jgi:peptidoglycan LD-endopeptidase LytH
MKKRTTVALWVLLAMVIVPCLIPEVARIPVSGATARDWNAKSFWYEPWGASGVHKGIDIFAPEGRPVVAPVAGLVIFTGRLRLGGNVVAVLGPKWRIHYCAHLRDTTAKPFRWVGKGAILGSVGSTGNAAGKAPHLHYTVLSVLPRVWQLSLGTQGWKKMFFVDPGTLIR